MANPEWGSGAPEEQQPPQEMKPEGGKEVNFENLKMHANAGIEAINEMLPGLYEQRNLLGKKIGGFGREGEPGDREKYFWKGQIINMLELKMHDLRVALEALESGQVETKYGIRVEKLIASVAELPFEE
ncbi:MAG: hypothetical protein HY001_01515 [Candidatus Portnoybacteria bacterium]|nr:hypothetical protein [Candidatus Portnoybacteria bacterium]